MTRLLPLLLTLVLAACGGSDESTSDTGTTTPASGGGDGAELFTNTCGGCHTLSAAGTDGQTGPDLDDVQPSRDEVLTAIEEGPGVMPEKLYEGADAEAVADYVSENAGG